MTATLTPQSPLQRLERAAPGIYPWEISEGRYTGRMAVFVPPTYMPRLQQIPGALYSKADTVWTLPKSYPAVLSLGAMARETGLPIKPHPDLKAWVAEQKAQWAELRGLAEHLDKDAPKTGVFFPHQEADGDWLSYGGGALPTRGRLLLSETGIGKTAGAINGLRKLGLPDVNRPVLVVAPKKTLRTAWADDLAEYHPDAQVVVATGTATQRRKAIEAVKAGTANVLVIGWEALKTHTRFAASPGHALKKCEACGGPKQSPEEAVSEAKCQVHARELNEIPWSVIIADELHRAMNNTSQTTMALWGVVRAAPEALRWGLTGTPVSRKVEQAWTCLHYADADAWPVKSSWIGYYAESGYNMAGFFETFGLKPTRTEEFQQTFAGISRRRLKAEVLDLPPLIMGGGMIREVEMGTEQKKAYASMRDEMVLMVKEGTLTAANTMTATGRLTMLASATGYPDPAWEAEAALAAQEGKEAPPKRMLLRLPSGKIDAVLEDMLGEEFGEDPVAVSLESRRLLRLLEAQMVDRGIDPDQIAVIAGDMTQVAADQAIYDFQEGRKRWMLYTYAAGGTGVTLTAARWLLRVQRSWSPILWKQGLDRVHRIGSERHDSVNVLDYITVGTVETKQIDRHGENTALLESLVNDQGKLLELLS